MWYATIALALRTASSLSSSPKLGWATGKLHKNLANLSISPESSSVSHTVDTWEAVKFNVGKANIGLGAKTGCEVTCENWSKDSDGTAIRVCVFEIDSTDLYFFIIEYLKFHWYKHFFLSFFINYWTICIQQI